jgi:hypothetical protein
MFENSGRKRAKKVLEIYCRYLVSGLIGETCGIETRIAINKK